MRLSEVEKKAREMGIKDTWKFAKTGLIRQIQRSEGNNECFSTKNYSCNQTACCWWEDCRR